MMGDMSAWAEARQVGGHYGMCAESGHPKDCPRCAERWRTDPGRPRPCLVCTSPCRSEGQLCRDCATAGHYVTDDTVVVALAIGGNS